LLQLIENHRSAADKRDTVHGRLDPERRAVEETQPDGALDIGDRFRHGGLRDRQPCGSLSHAPQLGDLDQDMQVAQFKAPPDAFVPLHWGSPYRISYGEERN
jgi:hypothetical protein